MFPRGDCVLLPIENTTAELLARYIAGRLLESLRTREGFVPEVLRVEVEEGPGQSATIECADNTSRLPCRQQPPIEFDKPGVVRLSGPINASL